MFIYIYSFNFRSKTPFNQRCTKYSKERNLLFLDNNNGWDSVVFFNSCAFISSDRKKKNEMIKSCLKKRKEERY